MGLQSVMCCRLLITVHDGIRLTQTGPRARFTPGLILLQSRFTVTLRLIIITFRWYVYYPQGRSFDNLLPEALAAAAYRFGVIPDMPYGRLQGNPVIGYVWPEPE